MENKLVWKIIQSPTGYPPVDAANSVWEESSAAKRRLIKWNRLMSSLFARFHSRLHFDLIPFWHRFFPSALCRPWFKLQALLTHYANARRKVSVVRAFLSHFSFTHFSTANFEVNAQHCANNERSLLLSFRPSQISKVLHLNAFSGNSFKFNWKPLKSNLGRKWIAFLNVNYLSNQFHLKQNAFRKCFWNAAISRN